MATRQYIGARYVPKFFENPNGTCEWAGSTIGYEALTVVMYLGNSFTSKKPVPAGVDITNTEYWVNTGNYNSQIEEYRRVVDEYRGDVEDYHDEVEEMKDGTVNGSLQNQINTLNTNKRDKGNLLVIGNSFVNYGCADKLKEFFSSSHVFTISGGGFVSYYYQSRTYEDCVDDAIADNSFDNNSITDIIFVSAMGDSRALEVDRSAYETALKTTLQSIKTKIKTNFPNCKRTVVTLAETRDVAAFTGDLLSSLFATHSIFKQFCTNYGIEYIGWSGFNTLFKSEYIQSDHYHPNTSGAGAIGTWIVNAYFGNAEYENYESRGSCALKLVNETDTISVVCVVSPDSVSLNVRIGTLSSGTYNVGSNGLLINTTQLSKPVPGPMYTINLNGHLYAHSDGTEIKALTPTVGATIGEGQLVIRNRAALTGSASGNVDVSIDVLNNIEYKLAWTTGA